MLFKTIWSKPPSGYAAGATLQRVRLELGGRLKTVANAGHQAKLEENGGRFRCIAEERIESHYLMHIVTVEFALHVPSVVVPGAKISLYNGGLIRKKGIRCRITRSQQEGLKHLCADLMKDAAIGVALTGLNFRSCQIVATEAGWTAKLEPYGGSEVVNRMPAFRRYIRLGSEQVDYLVLALHALNRVLSHSSNNA